MSNDKPAPQPAVPEDDPHAAQAPDQGSTDRARRREAAQRRLRSTTMSKRAAVAWGLTAVAGVAAITVAGSIWAPPAPEMDTAAQAAELPATPALTVCPGAPVLPDGAADGTDVEFSPLSSDDVTALSVAAMSDLAGNIPGIAYFALQPDAEELPSEQRITDALDDDVQQGPPATAATDGTVNQHADFHVIAEPDDDGRPIAMSTQPVGGSPGTAAATTQFAATDGDLAGMTASACAPAAHEHWLTGAITTTGTTAVLTLTNPSSTNSTVDLTVFDTNGRVDASGASGIVLAPGQSRSMLVAGLAPQQESVAVQVSSSGGPVAADIQQHRLDGIVPAGVDTQQAAATGSELVIPGLVIDDDAAEINESAGLEGQSPSLHLASTGAAASATITLRGPDGPVDVPSAASAVELAPGATTTVDLSGVAPGVYAVEISADTNIVASATSVALNPSADENNATGTAAAVDTAYMPSTAPIRGETVVTLPAVDTPDSQLVLTSNADATVEVTPIDNDGELGDVVTQEIAADTAVTLTTDDAAAYFLETGSNAVHAGLVVESSTGITGLPVNTVRETGAGLPVRLGY